MNKHTLLRYVKLQEIERRRKQRAYIRRLMGERAQLDAKHSKKTGARIQ